MNLFQKRLLKLPVPDIENAYILISASQREDDLEVLVKANMSFLYDAGEYAAEWEPEHGPIQVWHKCDPDADRARDHYYYDYTDSGPFNWNQSAVSRNGLCGAFLRGDYRYIFSILANWARD
jgi:hypothetical protein